MARCTACVTELSELSVFCSNCGQPNEPDFDQLLTQKLGGRYQIYRRLGEGGLSTVFVATDTRADDIVVVKVSDPRLLVQFASGTQAEAREAKAYWVEMIDRMRREVEALADLRHPNIVRVLATGAISDELRYVVMEFLRGRTLREEMNSRRRFDFVDAARIGAEVAAGLSAVHARGIIHRDLTPRNIFLCEPDEDSQSDSPITKVIDFGIARFPQPPGAQTYTQHAVMAGTPGYASPEQCQNLTLDHRADIYSLGVVLYEMVTGQRPFTGRAATEIALKQMQGNPTRPREIAPEIPLRLEALILRALAREPHIRHQSAEELASELNAIATRIVVPVYEPAVAATAFASDHEIIKPIVIPLTESAGLITDLANPSNLISLDLNEHSAHEEKLFKDPPFAQIASQDEPVAAEQDVFPSQVEQLKTVRQRRRRVALATAAVIAFFAIGGLLLAKPWNNHSQPEQVAETVSPSASTESFQATPDSKSKEFTPAETTQTNNETAASTKAKAQSASAPSPELVRAAQPQTVEAAKKQTATHSANTASRHQPIASSTKATTKQKASPAPPPVNLPQNDSTDAGPLIAEVRMPQPSSQPGINDAPKPVPSGTPAPIEVATNSDRTERDEAEAKAPQTPPVRRPEQRIENTPQASAPDAEPKLYSWRGEVDRVRHVTIEMPGEPGTIQIPRDFRKRVGVVEPPSPSNGWRRVVLRVFGDGLVSVILRWYPNRRSSDPRYQWAKRGNNS